MCENNKFKTGRKVRGKMASRSGRFVRLAACLSMNKDSFGVFSLLYKICKLVAPNLIRDIHNSNFFFCFIGSNQPDT